MTDENHLEAIRSAFAITAAESDDGPARHQALWRAGEDQCFLLGVAPDGPVIGWLSAPTKSWASVAVAADGAWRMAPHAAEKGPVSLVARDVARGEVVRWQHWWRFSQHAHVGSDELRMRTAPALFDKRFRLRDEHGRLGSVAVDLGNRTHQQAGQVVASPLAFSSLRITWARQPADLALVGLMVTYVLVIRTLRTMPDFRPIDASVYW